jgi:outer membrane protein insertion porin family
MGAARHPRRVFLFACWILACLVTAPFGEARAQDTATRMSSVPAPVVSGVTIEILDFVGDKAAWVEMARQLISVEAGKPFSSDEVAVSIEALKACNRFQSIDVDSKEVKEGMLIQFRLTPFRLIKEIRIHGAFPLFERDVFNAMTTYTGNAFVKEDLPKQEALIRDLYKNEGFRSPEVEIKATEDPEDGQYVLDVDIKKGPYLKLETLEIEGNRAFSDLKLKLKMKVWRVSSLPGSAGRFSEKDLKADVKNLAGYYWKEGYPEAKVDFTLKRDPEQGQARVILSIAEGARYKVTFTGNEAFWDRTLRKDLVFLQDGVQKDAGFRRSLRKLRERYRSEGYLETRVKVEERTTSGQGASTRFLGFVIAEGPRTTVEAVRITGNHAFGEEKIKKQMLTGVPGLTEAGVYIPERLEDDLLAVKSLYLKDGFMSAKVSKEVRWNPDKTAVAIDVNIEEGVRTVVSSVQMHGLTVISEDKAYDAIHLKVGEPFRRYMIEGDENALSALVAKKGHPYVEVKGDVSISDDQSRALIVYDVNEGPYAEMGETYTRGNFLTRKRILDNELEMRPGEPFSLRDMLQGERNIRNTDLFNSVWVRAVGLKEKRERIDLFVEVEEKKPYYWESGVGYDSERGVFASTRVGDRNLFGTNKDAWVSGEASQIGYRAESRVREPRLFGSRVSATTGVFGERREEFNQDFGTKTYGASLSLYRKWFGALGTGLSFRYEGRDQYRVSSDGSTGAGFEDDRDQYRPRSILVASPTIIYDTRDSLIRPTKGTFSQFYVDVSRGLTNELDDFLKYRVDLRYYWTPLNRLTLACLGRLGYLDPLNAGDRVPEDQLFFLGGTSSVRGFDENLLRFDAKGDPVGGRTAVNGSLEARIDLGGNLELAAFYDIGRIGDTIDKAKSNDFRESIGLGLRYLTPIGPISVLYGMKLDPKKGESPGRFHLSVGYTF